MSTREMTVGQGSAHRRHSNGKDLATIRPWFVAVGLLGVVVAAHGGAISGGFHYDDKPSITDNRAIRQWQPWVYLTSPFAGSAEPGAAGYRPLTLATFAINYQLGGLDPSGFLLVNLLLHLTASWLVFVAGRLLLKSDWWAAVAALIFAVHPLNAEAINYAVARSSLLAVCCSLLAFWAFVRRHGGGGRVWTVVGVSAFVAALLSKESSVALMVPLATYHLLVHAERSAKPWRRSVSSLSPYLAALGVYLVVWWNLVATQAEQYGRVAVYPLWTFLEIAGRSLGLWFWPFPLGLDHPLIFVDRFDVPTALGLVAGIIVILVLVAWSWRRYPVVSWCILWTVSGLTPLAPLPWMTVNGLLQENRMAFSALGLAWLTAVVAREGISALERRVRGGGSAGRRRLVGSVAAAGLVAFVAASIWVDRERSWVWADDVRLWQEVVARSPGRRGAHVNLGAAYLARNDFERAEASLQQAIVITPNEALPYYALGKLAYRREQYDRARLLFLKTARLAPDYAETYHMLGRIALKRGEDQEASGLFEHALRLDPRDAGSAAMVGLLAQRSGDDQAAMRLYYRALEIDPDQTLARNNLGALLLKGSRWAEALEQFSVLLARAPEDHDAALNRAVALNALGRNEEARKAVERLLERLPPEPRFDAHRRAANRILGRPSP